MKPKMLPVTRRQTFMGRLEHGADLLEALNKFCIDEHISLGRVEAIGAVKKAALGYYDQDEKCYRYFEIDRHLEILNLVGNISLKDGKPFVHAHVTLADEAGRAFGGHLIPGTPIFACEAIIQAFDGPQLHRKTEPITGLPLWS
ncbi:MAG: DNA-binding protein [Magnetococcales bacterium]|nr:DNA-binding protein [Magnetococcales bacterium]